MVDIIPEGLLHESSSTPFISVIFRAINCLLFWKFDQLLHFQCIKAFNGCNCWNRPISCTLSLINYYCFHSFAGPVLSSWRVRRISDWSFTFISYRYPGDRIFHEGMMKFFVLISHQIREAVQCHKVLVFTCWCPLIMLLNQNTIHVIDGHPIGLFLCIEISYLMLLHPIFEVNFNIICRRRGQKVEKGNCCQYCGNYLDKFSHYYYKDEEVIRAVRRSEKGVSIQNFINKLK